MNEYKRLTERRGNLVIDKCGNCENVKNPQGCTDKNCYVIMKSRLAELEDKIEQGLLVELPVKIGDTVYSITPKCKWLGQCTEFDQHCCSRRSCDAFITEEKFTMYLFNRIGDDVVVTKEEAKAKLRGGK